jgi:tRNA (mo5U34)-methyltransferase
MDGVSERRPGFISADMTATALREQLATLGFYHTVDVGAGVNTKGWWDLRHALPLMPFPDVAGKRCLDIGTWDGFYAWELERRGAAEVVAIDVPDLADLDYPPEMRVAPGFDPSLTGKQPRFAGFHMLHDLLGSNVEWRGANIYELNPEEFGQFDAIVLGSLLVHLRDPVRALDAVRSVLKPDGKLLLADFLYLPIQLLPTRRPVFELRGESDDFQWWCGNDQGLRRLLHVAGFTIEKMSKMFLLKPGPLVEKGSLPRGKRDRAMRLGNWLLTGDNSEGGHLHRAYLAHRRF